MRILIADDDAVTRLILKSAVEHFGHDCVAAQDGHAAWERLQAEPFEVVISDRLMPGIDGLELCRLVRGQAQAGYCYFIFLTALNERSELMAGIEAGADDYLTKPLNPDELQVRLLVAGRITELHRQLAAQQAELRRLNDRLYEQARRDPLTQLRNRLCLREDLAMIEATFEAEGRCYCAIMCDLDHFKDYNDRLGHAAGDEALRAVASALEAQCRSTDRLYRYGGEEFVLILTEVQLGVAMTVAERMRASVRALTQPAPGGCLSISAGVSELRPRAQMNVPAWLRAADLALYAAKAQGRDRVIAADVPDDNCAQAARPEHLI
jgi:two-component system, cell cycle response regulator